MNRRILLMLIWLLVTAGFYFAGQSPVAWAGYRPINNGIYVYNRDLSPDERFMVAVMGALNSDHRAVYLINLATGQTVALTTQDPTLSEVLWVPDGQGVLVLRETSSSVHTLHYLPVNGNSEVMIATIRDSTARLYQENFILTETGYSYLYESENSDYDNRLYLASLPDGQVTQIPETLPAGNVGYMYGSYRVSPNQAYLLVYYRDESNTLPSPYLLINVRDGTWHSLAALAGISSRSSFQFDPTTKFIVIHEVTDSNRPEDYLHVFDLESEILTTTIHQDFGTNTHGITPDGSDLLYTRYAGNNVYEIHKYHFATGESTLLYQSTTGRIPAFWFAPNEKRMVFYNWEDNHLYSLQYDPPEPEILLSTLYDPSTISNTDNLLITSHGWVVFVTPGAVSNYGDWLYTIPLDGSVPPLLIHPEPTVRQFRLDPDGTRVYYTIETAYNFELITEPVIPNKEGPTPLFQMPPASNGPSIESILSNGNVLFRVHPDYYIADGLPPLVHWGSENAVGVEGYTVNLPVELESATAIGPITIPIEIEGGSATDGIDYHLLTETVTVPQGARIGNVYVEIVADGLLEVGEIVILKMGSPIGARLTEPFILTVNLRDDPLPIYLPTITRHE